MRLSTDVMMMVNSTLVVQIFFMMSSFLLAHKLLQQRRRGDSVPKFNTFMETFINRIIRSLTYTNKINIKSVTTFISTYLYT